MKKTLSGSLAVLAMMATSAAFATPDNRLTTKDYVDDGLRYLYQRYEPVKTDVSSLKTTVGDSTGGLVKRVTDLENNSSVGAVTQLEQLVGTRGDGTQQNPSTGLVADVEDLQDTVGDSTGGLVKDVEDLKDVVGDSSDGLVKDVADLQDDVDDLKDIAKEYVAGTNVSITAGAAGTANEGKMVVSSTEYVGGTGVTVTAGVAGTANEGKMVVSADVVTSWDPSVLTANP